MSSGDREWDEYCDICHLPNVDAPDGCKGHETIAESNARQSDYFWWWDAPDGRLAGVSFKDWQLTKGRNR